MGTEITMERFVELSDEALVALAQGGDSDAAIAGQWRSEFLAPESRDGLSGGALGTDVLSPGFSASARTFRYGDHIISACGSVSSVAAAAAAAEDIYEYFIQGEI